MVWYLWLLVIVVVILLYVEIGFRWRMNRVRLVSREEGYPLVIPFNSPLMELLRFFLVVMKGNIKELHVTNLYESFQQMKTPCMATQTVFMGMHMVVNNKPEAIKRILVERTKYIKMTHVSHDGDRLLAQGVFNAEGEDWQHQRTVLNPSFKYKKLRSLVPLFCETTGKLIDQIEAQGIASEKKPFDVKDWITRTTLDAIGRAGFGYDFNAVDHNNENQLKNYNVVMSGLTNMARIFGWYRALPLKSNIEVEREMTTFESYIDKIINEKRKVVANPSFDESSSDLLGLLISDGAELTDMQLRHNVITFFIAGHDTISSCLSFGLCMMQQHPDIQKRLQQEVDEVLHGNLPDHDSLKKLKYMGCFIKEVLRLYPPAVALMRIVNEDDVLDGYQLRKGMYVFVSMFVLHRLKEYWGEDALEFNPDRWGEGKAKPIPFSYLPFSSGARQCIGSNFAQLEIKVVLSMLLQRYNIVADPTCKVPFGYEMQVSLIPKPGHTLCLAKRKF